MSDGHHPNSELLLRRATEGDLQARAELLERYRGRLRRMIATRLDIPSAVLNETFGFRQLLIFGIEEFVVDDGGRG